MTGDKLAGLNCLYFDSQAEWAMFCSWWTSSKSMTQERKGSRACSPCRINGSSRKKGFPVWLAASNVHVCFLKSKNKANTHFNIDWSYNQVL